MDLVGFALAVLLIELTPGPNMAWLAGLAATEGRRTGLSAVWGVAVGLFANAVLAALGLVALLQAAPQAMVALRLAGAAMMVWLAVEAWRGAGRLPGAAERSRAEGRAFITGALINLLNPKAYLFFVVVVLQFLAGDTLSLTEALALAAVSVTIATAIHVAIVLAGGRANAWLTDPARTRAVRRLFALVMLAVAASVLLSDLGERQPPPPAAPLISAPR